MVNGSAHECGNHDGNSSTSIQPLEESMVTTVNGGQPESEIRIWMDGAFDMMHFGHMNAFRLGKALGTTLIVGVNSDESITLCKGKPVTSEDERIETVKGCKWVDEIVTDVPYVMNDTYLKEIILKHRLDFIVHGDDPCIVDGKDAYEAAQALGKYLTIPRTEGISTTDIVGRILRHIKGPESASAAGEVGKVRERSPLFNKRSNFLTTGRVVRQFSDNAQPPAAGARVVYIAGTWDLLHAGHLSLLEKSLAHGDYLIVGIYSDEVAASLSKIETQKIRDKKELSDQVMDRIREYLCERVNIYEYSNNMVDHSVKQNQEINKHYGGSSSGKGDDDNIDSHPIMSMEERMLSVLGCKYVSDVLMDAPYVLSSDMISALNISIVVNEVRDSDSDSTSGDGGVEDPYRICKEMGIYRTVQSSFAVTATDIMGRIRSQQEKFTEKFSNKKALEEDYYAARYGK